MSEPIVTKSMGFVPAMLDYFGRLSGETAVQFRDELKALTDDDRKFFREGLATVGYTVTS
jgi:hypothetical protein